MKKQKEIEQLAEKYYPPYPDGIITDEIRALREGFIKGYRCQEDMVNEIKKQIYDFNIDLKESTSTYVKQNCEGAIFGLNRLLKSLNKQD